MNYHSQFHQFSTQFFENIKNVEDTTTYDEINADFKTQNDEILQMFINQDKGIKDLKPCLVSLERTNNQNSDLLDPIQYLTDEVIHAIFYLLIMKKLHLFLKCNISIVLKHFMVINLF